MNTDHADRANPAETGLPFGRRGFLRSGAVVAAAVGVAGTVAAPAEAAPASAPAGHRRVPVDRISIQLYTVRDILAADPAGTLATLARIGYTRVEVAGTAGLTAEAFRALLDANGIRATSGHFGIPQPFDAAAWEARFGYHNHHFEFLRMTNDRRTGFEILTQETDPDLVHLEVDLFWTCRGARDPVDVIRANRGRVRQVHVKDMDLNGTFADPGQGLIDFGRIFQHAREAGLVEYIVERDDAGIPPRQPADALTTARVGYDYLAALRF